jgi:hypothetical protein
LTTAGPLPNDGRTKILLTFIYLYGNLLRRPKNERKKNTRKSEAGRDDTQSAVELLSIAKWRRIRSISEAIRDVLNLVDKFVDI